MLRLEKYQPHPIVPVFLNKVSYIFLEIVLSASLIFLKDMVELLDSLI